MTGWLALMSLDKMMKENDKLGESKSQLKHSINDLRASKCAPEESLISTSGRAESAAYQVTSIRLRLATSESKLNAHPHRGALLL